MKKTLPVIFCLLLFELCSNAQWQQTSALGGGNIETMVLVKNNLFAGTLGSGVFLSSNNGNSWTAVNSGLLRSNIFSLTVIDTTIFAATDSGGVFASTNFGASWTAMNSGLTKLTTYTLAAFGSNLFVGTFGGGAFLSTNNGQSWKAINTGLTATDVLSFAMVGADLFAGTGGGGVCLSTNNGASWTMVNTGLGDPAVESLVSDGTNLYAGTQSGNVYLSTNKGTLWTLGSSGLKPVITSSLLAAGGYIFESAYGAGIYLTSNNGASWSPVNHGLSNLNVNSLTANSTTIYAATDGNRIFKANLNDTIEGNVGTKTGPVNSGYVKLYRNNINRHMQKGDSVQIDGLGNYVFKNVFSGGNYLVWANSTSAYPTTIPTYGDSSAIWDSAKVVSVGFAKNTSTQNIQLKELTGTIGKGEISGKVLQGNKYAKMTAAGDPIRGIDITIGKKPKPSLNIIAHTVTDVNGNYAFINLPSGNYQVLVDIPGLPMDSTYNPDVTSSDSIFTNLVYYADSAKIYVHGTTGIQHYISGNSSFNLFPNPANENFTIQNGGPETAVLQLFDFTGQLILTQFLQSGSSSINSRGLAQGVYNICITDGQGQRSDKRLVIIR